MFYTTGELTQQEKLGKKHLQARARENITQRFKVAYYLDQDTRHQGH